MFAKRLGLLLAVSATAWCLAVSNCYAAVEYDETWTLHEVKGYYFKKCDFGGGEHQYLIFYPGKRQWVYWFNPSKRTFWCACPTVEHPRFGKEIKEAKDLFLIALKPDKSVEVLKFPLNDTFAVKVDDAIVDEKSVLREDFVSATVKLKSGKVIPLGCPPPDLPDNPKGELRNQSADLPGDLP